MSEVDNEKIRGLTTHPFTLLSLSDREKFHTGFLAYCINLYGKEFAIRLFGDKGFSGVERVRAVTEVNGADLVVCVCDAINKEICGTQKKGCAPRKHAKAIVEVKLKTDLHSNQLDRLASKEKFSGKHLISLFKPIDSKEFHKDFNFLYLRQIPNALEGFDKKNIGVEDATLVSMWSEYLLSLGKLVDKFTTKELGKIDDDVLIVLKKIKLNGIFQRYRFSLINNEFKHHSNKYLENDLGFGDLIIKTDINNTHGEALFEVCSQVTPIYRVGLQWQRNVVKLFAEGDQKSDSHRDDLLIRLSELAFDSDDQMNKTGKFRSITIRKNWDVMGDISEKPKELFELFRQTLESWRIICDNQS